jgi:hypothetical protein
MARAGNRAANAHWEGALIRPGGGGETRQWASTAELDSYVWRKYVTKEFARGPWPPTPVDDEEIREIVAGLRGEPEAPAQEERAPEAAPREEEEEAPMVQEEVFVPQPDLINLLDLDWDVMPASADDAAAAAAPDPFAELQEVFPAGQEESAGWTAFEEPPVSLTFKEWDMAATLVPAAMPAAVSAEAAKTQEPPAAQTPQTAAYRPPWAPPPALEVGGGMEAADPFAAFSAVPQQFTTTPSVPSGQMPWATTPSQQQQQQGWGQPPPQRAAPPPPQGPLPPHEQRADQLVLSGLATWSNHADLLATKGVERPTGPAVTPRG